MSVNSPNKLEVPRKRSDNTCMLNEKENKKVWDVIRKYIKVPVLPNGTECKNVWRYNTKRKSDRVIVWKSYGSSKYSKLYKKIVDELKEMYGGYELVDGSSGYGDGSMSGVKKIVKA